LKNIKLKDSAFLMMFAKSGFAKTDPRSDKNHNIQLYINLSGNNIGKFEDTKLIKNGTMNKWIQFVESVIIN
jgi:hypothetical protein